MCWKASAGCSTHSIREHLSKGERRSFDADVKQRAPLRSGDNWWNVNVVSHVALRGWTGDLSIKLQSHMKTLLMRGDILSGLVGGCGCILYRAKRCEHCNPWHLKKWHRPFCFYARQEGCKPYVCRDIDYYYYLIKAFQNTTCIFKHWVSFNVKYSCKREEDPFQPDGILVSGLFTSPFTGDNKCCTCNSAEHQLTKQA